jgi:hypothetical protein
VAIYLLHSSVPLVRANGERVQHYMGWTPEGMFWRRFRAHQQGHKSSKIVQAFLAKGAELRLGNYWPELTRDDEVRMKRNGHLESKCLLCELSRVRRKIDALHGTVPLSPPTATEQS